MSTMQLIPQNADVKTGLGSPALANIQDATAHPPPPLQLQAMPVSDLPDIDDADELLADTTLKPPAEIIQGLLHQGTKGVVASCSKAGKTWLLLDWGLSVATGTKFLGWVTVKGRVLYINLEIPKVWISERLKTLKTRKGIDLLENFDIWTLRGELVDFESLLQHLPANTYSLIIVDPIYKLMVGQSENMAGGVGALCHNIERLIEKTGAAVVYAHHFTKGNQSKKKAMDRMSGSGVFARDADTIVTLTEHKQDGCFSVEMSLRNLPPQDPFVVEWSFPLMLVRADLDPDDLKTMEGDKQDKNLPLLDLLEKPLTTGAWEELAVAAGISRATFHRYKKKLEVAGQITFNSQNKTWSQFQEIETDETKVGALGLRQVTN